MGHPWYGWESLPDLVPDRVQDFINLATGQSQPGEQSEQSGQAASDA